MSEAFLTLRKAQRALSTQLTITMISSHNVMRKRLHGSVCAPIGHVFDSVSCSSSMYLCYTCGLASNVAL
jgi:hypothetical protein